MDLLYMILERHQFYFIFLKKSCDNVSVANSKQTLSEDNCCYHAQQWWIIWNQKERVRENQNTDLRDSLICLHLQERDYIQ
jgi:hypothetical protein